MTDPPETNHDPARGRRRAVLVALVAVAAVAALVAAITAGQREVDTAEPVTTGVSAGETTSAPTPTTSPEATTEPTASAPETNPDRVSTRATPPPDEPGEDLPTTVDREPLAADVAADLEVVLQSWAEVLQSPTARIDTEAIARLGRSGDLRIAWVIADLMRFFRPDASGLTDAFRDLTGIELGWNPWLDATNKLIDWDTPAPPGFAKWKGAMYTLVEPGWAPFFDDEDSLIDWRHVTWGGVPIDARPLDAVHLPCPRGCIPALNDPRLVPASEGDYYPDDSFVFAVSVNGEAVAFPKNMMEIHEMVNITIGGRRLGIPYCTLCGSAQAYFTDDVPDSVRGLLGGADTFELRTSGLLSRSNKMMYEFHTRSMFDTFTGQAVSGPLREAGVGLLQTTMVTSRWGDWKEANPHTLIVAMDGGIGRSYPEDPLGDRDDYGPIFPIGDLDERLPVQAKVLGVLFDGEPQPTVVAFHVAAAHRTLEAGGSVELEGITVTQDGGGLRAWGPDGTEIPAHEAFWFAWSQFHPQTRLWSSEGL